MTKIKSFDKQNLKEIRKEIDEALVKVAKSNGIKLSIGSISFQADTFTTKITAIIENSKTGVIPGILKWQVNFKRFALYQDGLKASDLGKEIVYAGEKHQLVGAMGANAQENPIIIMNMRTEKFRRVPAEIVKTALFVAAK